MTISSPNASDSSRVSDQDTADLIGAASRGDEQAMAELYTAHFDRVYSYLRVALNDLAEAEEATQEIFMKVLRCLDRYEQGREPFGDWLLAIARNHVTDRLRKRAVGGGEDVSLSKADIATMNGGAEETLRALRGASDEELLLLLERLPEAQRQAIVLGYVLDFGQRETARVLGCTEEATRDLQSRALAALRGRLASAGREATAGTRLAMKRYRARSGALQPTRSVSLLR
jgi:RNA polymerase sigma-70 factor (ECF subfamily)